MTFEHMHFTDNYYITKNERNTLGEEWIPTYCNWTSKNTDAHAYTNIVYPSGADVRSKFRSGFSNLKLRLSLEFICMCINIYLSLSPSPLLKEFNKATLIMYVCMYVFYPKTINMFIWKLGTPKSNGPQCVSWWITLSVKLHFCTHHFQIRPYTRYTILLVMFPIVSPLYPTISSKHCFKTHWPNIHYYVSSSCNHISSHIIIIHYIYIYIIDNVSLRLVSWYPIVRFFCFLIGYLGVCGGVLYCEICFFRTIFLEEKTVYEKQ